VILPLTVLRRLDCLLAPTKARVLDEYETIQTRPDSVIRSLLSRITGRPFFNLSRLDFAKLLDDPNQFGANPVVRQMSPQVINWVSRNKDGLLDFWYHGDTWS
jgi:type I restriction enzyme M protein